MSTWETFKFWLIKELMPLFIALSVFATILLIFIVWGTVDFLREEFRCWKNKRRNK